MKKTNYNAPAMQITRFDTEGILSNVLLDSGIGTKGAGQAGTVKFDESNTVVEGLF